MCTLIALHRCVPGAPLIVAANRDEFLDRPSRPPALVPGRRRWLAAPLDARGGGTWLGVNANDLFVGITNRPCASPDPNRRSRGLVVLEALDAGSAASAVRLLAKLPPGAYNPFNLFVADSENAFALVYEGRPSLQRLHAGVHVIGNADPNAASVPKVGRLLRLAEQASVSSPQSIADRLAAICRGHEGMGGPLDDTCIHAGSYGTRSSSILWLGATTRFWWFADGPPCTTEYDDFTHLLHGIGHATGAAAGERAARAVS